MPRADTSTTVEMVQAGCLTCHHGEPGWTAANAVAVAARHHQHTGHVTWARQTTVTHFGDPSVTPPAPTLPGIS